MVELILPGKGRRLVRLLAERRGMPTMLRLSNGREVTAWNCAWGRDWDADWEHLTLNLSPRVAGADVMTLSTAQVSTAACGDAGRSLYRRAPAFVA